MSRIEIKEQALKSNIATISRLAPIDKIYAVLKDNAYGHGLWTFASLCAGNGIKKAVVRGVEEALVISEIFEEVLCLAETNDFKSNGNVCFAVNSFEVLRQIPKNTKIHLKIDTGMHRCGISVFELSSALEFIVNNGIELSGVFSHLRSADELSSESFWQEKNFEEIRRYVSDFCTTRNIPVPKFHIQNSAGLFRSGGIGGYDAVRVGIALYGYMDMPNAVGAPALSPVASLWADKICSRDLRGGVSVGYGGIGKIKNDSSVSIYDIGYADGFPRAQPLNEYTFPGGNRCIGRVSMDNICIDSIDDSVCIFDDAGRLAKAYGTISYEILTRLNPKIKRVVV